MKRKFAPKFGNVSSRLLSLLLALIMVLGMVPGVAAAAEGTTLYLKPNSNWKVDNARFAIYYWNGSGSNWTGMSDDDGDGVYEGVVPSGYSNVIFCRMNPNASANNWDNKWNQTGDLTIPTDGTNCYTVKDGTWDSGGGTWSTYTFVEPTFIIAGTEGLCGTEWAPGDPNNKMTLNSETGLYEKVYTNVAAGTYEFKVTDGTWVNAWPSSNYVLTVDAESNVTITFNETTKAVSAVAEPVPVVDYYLVGYINGADYGFNDDYANLGEYKFVDGTLTATFTQDSYIFVKTGDNANWYMTENYCSDTTTTLKNTTTGASEKMFVPGNVELTFTLTVNDDDTLTLSYVRNSGGSSGEDPISVDYYLAGYINGADVGIGNDSANLGTYKFEDDKVTVTFTETSYVVVKDSDGTQYWAETYCTDTTVTLKTGAGEKMMVPAGEHTFTLVVNGDGTLTLSYTTAVDVPEIPEGYNTVTLHFLKPTTWGSTINAWIWDANGKISGYEDYNTAWPGSPIPANAKKQGWYDITVGTAEPQAFNFIFNDGSNQTADLTTGAITGPTELWVVDGTVYTTAPIEWTHYTATIHFQKPGDWDAVSAYAWTDTNELLLGAWPGTVTSTSVNSGWYTTIIRVEIGKTLNFIFNNNDNGKQTANLTAGVLTGNTELWIDGSGNSVSKPGGWVDKSRTIHLPGTLPGPSWDPASNELTYDPALGLYTITFKDVTPGTYYYKIAVNRGWVENYGASGEPNGDNMSVNVPVKQDVTFWYNDSTHRVVCSVNYNIDAVITLNGTGISKRLTDPELDGLYTVTVNLSAGTYSGLKITYGSTEVSFNDFTLNVDKDVTFFFDPSTGMAYHNGSDVKVNTTNIYYNSKDLAYKAPFGAVATGEAVKFSITTGTDATAVALAIRGIGSVKMEKDGEAVNDVQRWICTYTFTNIGEYQYYFAITNGSDMVFYCDDNWNSYYKTGDYGKGGIGNPDDIFAYDLVVYEAGFETPDWMKDAVIYQIFPDRFFDGYELNNQAQTWARGTVDYEYVTDWYLLPENPEMADDPNYPTYALKGDGEWSNEIYGGDLKGIVEKIDYLKALGVNVIYLNPVFWSISNHRYDAVSYSEIDPILGTLGDFEELVKIAEENDMHIILDGVFNHVSDDSVYFDRYYKFLPDAAEKYDGKIGAYPYWAYVYDYMADNDASQVDAEAAAKTYFGENYGITDYSYTEWFAVQNVKTANEDTIGLRAGKEVYSYEGWWGYDSMPVIYSTNGSEYQTGNWAEEIIDGQNSVNAYWISKGMDGWRLDVANEVSDETWQHFRDSVKALDSEAVIIGEIWSDATYYLMGDMYDSVMNYVFRDAVAGFARGYLINRDNKAEKYDADLTADEAMTILEILRERYPEEAFYAMMNLVASHDTSRILSYLDDVEDDRYQKDIAHAFPTYEATSDRAKQLQYVVSFLQFTYAGAPTIYYGDEIGMVGGDDPDDRRAFTWGKGNQDIVEWYAELAAIRAAYPALRTGTVEPFSTGNDDVMGFVRGNTANTLVVMANRAATAKTIAYEGTWVDLISGKTFTDSVTVPAYRGVILVAENEVKPITVNTADLAPAYDSIYTVKVRCVHIFDAGTVTRPTCTEQGYTVYTCTVDGCGFSYSDNYIDEDLTAHTWGDWYQSKAPSVGSEGENRRDCINNGCDAYQSEPIPAINVPLYTIIKAKCENGKVTAQAIMAVPGSNVKVSAVPAEGYKVWELVVTDAAGNEIEVVDGKFKMPASNVTVSATFVYDLPYTDVADDAENYAAIAYMYENGLMIGTSTEKYVFNGDMTMTRAQIAMILYRLSGEPEVAYTGTFTDAPEGAWYTEAVEWAASENIINGVGNNTFAPNREITVVELAALVYRYAQCQQHGQCEAADWETESAAAMTWCVENGILSEDVTASDIASRNLAAEMFYAVDALVGK